jgi:hypothetical protein
MILGSKAKDVEALQAQAAQEAKLRLPSFEHANLVMQRRRAPVARDVGPPKRMNNTFREYQVSRGWDAEQSQVWLVQQACILSGGLLSSVY